MLSQKQLEKIRGFLERAQNPLFFFDNDVDGLASFLLLRKFCSKGKGIAIKSFPDLNVAYTRKLHEFKPDVIFVLDKPIISKGFLDAAAELNMPLVWIDHHPVPEFEANEIVNYFNPLVNENPSNEPTSYWCYKITRHKGDEWIAMLGCLADWFIPEFAETFSKEKPELFTFTNEPARALYETELGRIIKMLSFALLDRTSMVVKMLKNLIIIKDPKELLDITTKTASIHGRYKQINRKYEKILNKAKEFVKKNKKVLFFQYGGLLSLSSELANELFYLYPNKIVVVAYIKGTKVNVSLRAKIDVRKLAEKALEGIESTCGGHEHACGATLQVTDLPKFRDNLIKSTK